MHSLDAAKKRISTRSAQSNQKRSKAHTVPNENNNLRENLEEYMYQQANISISKSNTQGKSKSKKYSSSNPPFHQLESNIYYNSNIPVNEIKSIYKQASIRDVEKPTYTSNYDQIGPISRGTIKQIEMNANQLQERRPTNDQVYNRVKYDTYTTPQEDNVYKQTYSMDESFVKDNYSLSTEGYSSDSGNDENISPTTLKAHFQKQNTNSTHPHTLIENQIAGGNQILINEGFQKFLQPAQDLYPLSQQDLPQEYEDTPLYYEDNTENDDNSIHPFHPTELRIKQFLARELKTRFYQLYGEGDFEAAESLLASFNECAYAMENVAKQLHDNVDKQMSLHKLFSLDATDQHNPGYRTQFEFVTELRNLVVEWNKLKQKEC